MLSLIINISDAPLAAVNMPQPQPDLARLRRRFIRDLESFLQSHLNSPRAEQGRRFCSSPGGIKAMGED